MKKQRVRMIQIDWDGPYTLENLNLLKNDYQEYGVYQIYGQHTVYGSDILLYIGKADMQTIGKRISQENWWCINDSNQLKIYAGHLAGESTPDEETWSKGIDLAEKLLIYVHKPAYNTSSLVSIPDDELQDIHILNWGHYRNLLPEVSGLRWAENELDYIEYDIYKYTIDDE